MKNDLMVAVTSSHLEVLFVVVFAIFAETSHKTLMSVVGACQSLA